MTVDLKNFVSETLVNIIDGVSEAQEVVASREGAQASVNPMPRTAGKDVVMAEGSFNPISKVAFDVAVTATEMAKGGGKVGVKVAVFGAAAEGNLSAENTVVNRIQFTVPITYPQRQPE